MNSRFLTYLGAFCLALMFAFSTTGTQEVAADYQGHAHYHTVHAGGTIWGIATSHGVTVNEVLAYNPHVTNAHWVVAGTVVYVPAPHHPPPQPSYCSFYHYVSYGQTLGQISWWYGRPMHVIAHANGIYNFNYIYAGQMLCIP